MSTLPPSMTITDAAAEHIKALLAERSGGPRSEAQNKAERLGAPQSTSRAVERGPERGAEINDERSSAVRSEALEQNNKQSQAIALRVGIKKGGCAGMEYSIEWAETPEPLDEVVEDKGVKLFVDGKALMFLLGTQLDYQMSALKSGFVFSNPNQISACGCGESVQLRACEIER